MLWMDVLLGMELEEILRLVPCCHWIKTEVNQGVKNSSLATRAEHPAAELKKLHCLEPTARVVLPAWWHGFSRGKRVGFCSACVTAWWVAGVTLGLRRLPAVSPQQYVQLVCGHKILSITWYNSDGTRGNDYKLKEVRFS